MTKCVEKLPHNTATCHSRDGLQVFVDERGVYSGYCFACGTYVPDPYNDKPPGYAPQVNIKTDEQIQREIESIERYQTLDIPARKLKKESLEYFGVKVGVSEQDGITPTAHYYPYRKDGRLRGWKVRLIEPKRFWAIGTTKDVDLFGWEQAKVTGAKKLFITEGEVDAISLYQICKDYNKGTAYADMNPAIVSLINGAGSAPKDLLKFIPEIRKSFKEIILVFDTDEAGVLATQEVLKVIPDVLVATLPMKDVNACLMAGRGRAAYASTQFNASVPKNTRLVSGDDLHEAAKVPPKLGISWPWRHITERTRGLRFGETIYIGAGQKQGKSEVVNTLAAHFIREHGLKVFLIKPEESNNKTYKLVASKLAGKMFHDPNKPFDEAAYDKAGEVLRGHLTMLNLYQHLGWDTLKGDIRSAAAQGCKIIILDPITNLTNGLEAAVANTKLQEIAQELSAMALDLDVLIFIFCHLRNPDNGVPHERGGAVLSSQFAGSRAMARSCNLMLGLEGNRDPDLPKETKNMRMLVLLEDREFGETGKFPLYWDDQTGLFNEL